MKKYYFTRTLSVTCVAFLLLLNVSSLFAQTSQWAVKMFGEMGTERLHNFGSVALHADVEKRFQFKNIYDEDVVIASVSSNCGCTKASVSKKVIHPGEIGEVVAKVDTSGREHTKQRKATIRVVFSKPMTAEVQLQVKTYIRPDVGFEPGSIEFGTVQHGVKSVKKAYLQYEGRTDWALTGIQKNNPGIRAEAREVRRRGGSVVYEILVELKTEASPGYLHDLLKFQTNEQDPATSSVFLPVQGLVVEPLSAKPSFLQLGVLEQGKEATRNIVVSGSNPFKILKINSDDPRISGAKTDLTRSVHVIQIKFNASENAGPISGIIEIVTNLREEDGEYQKLTLPMTGTVVKEGELSASTTTVELSNPPQENKDSHSKTATVAKGVPQASEGLEPKPLSAEKKSKNRDDKEIRQNESADNVEMEELLLDELKILEQEATKGAEEQQEFVWRPVKKHEDKKEMTERTSPFPCQQGEWISNWKSVRDTKRPKYLAETEVDSVRRY